MWNISIFKEKVDIKPWFCSWRLEHKFCKEKEELRKWKIKSAELKMADYNLNYVPSIKEECTVCDIEGIRSHIWYVFICKIQAREECEGLSRECHLTIISSLSEVMLNQS